MFAAEPTTPLRTTAGNPHATCAVHEKWVTRSLTTAAIASGVAGCGVAMRIAIGEQFAACRTSTIAAFMPVPPMSMPRLGAYSVRAPPQHARGMPPTGNCSQVGDQDRTASLRPGRSPLDIRFARQAEHVFGDDVALDGERTAAERQRRMEQIAVVPDRVDDRRTGGWTPGSEICSRSVRPASWPGSRRPGRIR